MQATTSALGGNTPDGHPAILDCILAAFDDGASIDEIAARIGAEDDDPAPSDRDAGCMDDLTGLLSESESFAEDWDQAREPGAEGRIGRVALEALRGLALRKIAELSGRDEPASTEELARLALMLYRIEAAEKLRIANEKATADTAAQREAARRRNLPYEEKVAIVRRVAEEESFSRGGDWPSPMPDEAAAPAGESHAAPPGPASDAPADDEAQNEWDATAAHNSELDAPEAQDGGHARGVHDTDHVHGVHDTDHVHGAQDDIMNAPQAQDADCTQGARDKHHVRVSHDAYRVRGERDAEQPREGPDGWVAHEVEMRRRDAERRLWPTGPPLHPAAWSGPG